MGKFPAIQVQRSKYADKVVAGETAITGEQLKEGIEGSQSKLTPSSVNDGVLDKVIGFDEEGNLVKGSVGGGGLYRHDLYISYTYSGSSYNIRLSLYLTSDTLLTADTFFDEIFGVNGTSSATIKHPAIACYIGSGAANGNGVITTTYTYTRVINVTGCIAGGGVSLTQSSSQITVDSIVTFTDKI